MAAKAGAADDLMKRKPGGSEGPGGMTGVKDAWDRFVVAPSIVGGWRVFLMLFCKGGDELTYCLV